MKLSLKEQSTRSLLKLLLAPLVINFIIEFFSRRSLVDTLTYIGKTPLVFLYNSLIILATLSIVILFKRRRFVFTIITTIWIVGGIANGIILSNRVTPLTATDITLAKSALSIVSKYLTDFQTGLIVVAAFLVLIGIVFLFFKGPKFQGKINYKKNIIAVLSVWVILFASTKVALGTNVIASYFGNIAFAYLDYGFPYCFSNTLLNTGISKPKNYSEETIAAISGLISGDSEDDLAENNNLLLATNEENLNMTEDDFEDFINEEKPVVPASADRPNIIMLQLESFIDPTLANFLEFSEDPVPYFRELKENYPSGYLRVPSVGAGTANTEFEVISGMSLEFFGPGEYPYKTILQDSTCESINYDLKEIGYNTHAIHNNKGTFYDRKSVFSKLGFDTFTSLEYMNVEEYTPTDWAKDKYLTEEILKSLNSTEGTDFIYTISVQGHGDYPKEAILENPKIQVSGLEDEGTTNSFTYYVNQLYEMDLFIRELTDALSQLDEEVVLVMYGDHLPTLGFKDEDFDDSDIFQTEYVIWNNFDIDREDEDLDAYQLTSSLLTTLNIDNGVLTKFHNQFRGTEDYYADLKLLQYDMLYGKKYIYDGVNPFEATNLQMGIDKISITDVYEEDGHVYVAGENFNNFSKIYINKEYKETVFVNSNLLMLENTTLSPDTAVVVTQRTTGGGKVGSTEKFIYNSTADENLEENSEEEIIPETDTEADQQG